MHRLTLATRAFLFSFVPICLLLVASFAAINRAVHQRVRQDLRESLHNSDELLNRANLEFSHQNSALLAKLTDSAGLKASVGLLAEADRDPSLENQVRATLEAQLRELQNASPYDFLAISDLHDKTVAETPQSQGDAGFGSSPSGLIARQGVLFQVQSVPIEIGGETAAVLTLGRRFDLQRLAAGGEAALLKNGGIVRSTFPAVAVQQLEFQLEKNCPTPDSGCEVQVEGASYVVSVLQREQLGNHYQLLVFRSLDAPLQAFNRAFLPALVEVGLSGVLVALICTLVTSRSVSRPLRFLASQLETGAASGTLPERLHAGKGVREVDLVVSAFNRVAEAERRSRNELVLAKQAAESANRLKTEFLNNVSHELRTPINGVLGMTDLLLSTGLSEEQVEYARTVRDSARLLAALIDDVLDFSELETGRLRMKFSEMNLRGVFDDVVAATRARVARKPVSVEAAYTDSIPQFFIGEEARIRQALMYLCANATKFTDSGFIRISVQYLTKSEEAAELTFSVEDTGIGIASENLALIFEHFTQIDGSLTRRQGGTGIGLSITKALVELMGGRIGVQSSPNAGSTFWFSVPVRLLRPVECGATVDSMTDEIVGTS
ncbi:MAG TPA: ATP-binding protein [Bryobacteraceae bacterium]|jgi:signal transduction histidine kinase